MRISYNHYVDTRASKQRSNIRGIGSNRISPRVVDCKYRASVRTDGFFGIDGIPSSSQGRGKDQGQEWRKVKLLRIISSHPLCVAYWSVTIVVGALWQGWIHV